MLSKQGFECCIQHTLFCTMTRDILKIMNSLKDKPVFVTKNEVFSALIRKIIFKIKQNFNKCSGHCTVECVLNMDLQEL